MWIGVLLGAGVGWQVVEGVRDGSLASFLVDDTTAWIYVAALGVALVALTLAVSPRFTAGLGVALAVGLGVASLVASRPLPVDVPVAPAAQLGAASVAALAGALFGLAAPTHSRGTRIRRPNSRAVRRRLAAAA